MHLKSVAIAAALLAAFVVAAPLAHAQEPAPPPAACTVGAETGADPVEVKGSGQKASAPFHLDGGAYRAEWSMNGKAEGYRKIALKPTDDTSILRVNTIMDSLGETGGTSAETYIYNVKPGDYYLDVRAPSGWKVTLTPIAA